jgi:Spy/CpxP family protein refolding chaperone
MRFVSLAIVVALAGLASPQLARAQQDGGAKADEQIVIKQIQTDRRAVYAQNLELTDAESTAFWPVYDEFEAEMKKITDARLELLNQYAEKYDALDEAAAKQMLGRRLELDKQAFALRQKYAKKVQQVLPSVKALRYVQLQDRIDNILAGNMYSLIPLAR